MSAATTLRLLHFLEIPASHLRGRKLADGSHYARVDKLLAERAANWGSPAFRDFGLTSSDGTYPSDI